AQFLRALAYPYVAERSANESTRSPLGGRLNEYAYCLCSFDARDGLDQIFRYTRLKRPSFPCSQCRGGEYNNGDAGRCRILFEYHIPSTAFISGRYKSVIMESGRSGKDGGYVCEDRSCLPLSINFCANDRPAFLAS